MAVTTSQIIGNVTTILQDTGAVRRWSDSELLGWLNLGQVQIVSAKPDSMAITTEMLLAAGVTKQQLPDGTANYQDAIGTTLRAGIKLIDLVRNLGSTGISAGKAISIIDRKLLDQFNPDWHNMTPSTSIVHFMYDEKVPRVFYVTPAPHATTAVWVEFTYIAKPNVLTSGQNIELPDEYAPILMDYILFRAYSKESASQGFIQKALAYYASFKDALGNYTLIEHEVDPNNTSFSASPSIQR